MTKPIQNLINRDIDTGLTKILNYLANGIDEFVNFGSNIIYWDLNKENGNEEEDLPPILFLRNFLDEIDAISILIRSSSVDSCKNLLRTALENIFYLEYLLKEDSKNRALSYIVWKNIKTDKLLRQGISNTSEYERLLIKYQKDKFLKNSKPPIIKNADEMLKMGDKMFNLPKFNLIRQEYENTKARTKKPAWFTLFNGPKNIEELAKNVGLEALYEVMYRGLSDSIHGTDIIEGKIGKISGKENEVGINQIRSPIEAQSITIHCFNLSIVLFKSYFESRLPDKMSEYNNWYMQINGYFAYLRGGSFIVSDEE